MITHNWGDLVVAERQRDLIQQTEQRRRQRQALGMDEAAAYEIRVQGELTLDEGWSAWLKEAFVKDALVKMEGGGRRPLVSTLCATVRDQHALVDCLQKLSQIGLPILSVNRLPAVEGAWSLSTIARFCR